MPAGKRRRRVVFQKRDATGRYGQLELLANPNTPIIANILQTILADEGDESGGPDDRDGVPQAGPFVTQFHEWAQFTPQRGGEKVMADRLEGIQRFWVEVRSNSRTRTVDTDWRLVDERDDTHVYNIRDVQDPTDKRAVLEFLVEKNVAT